MSLFKIKLGILDLHSNERPKELNVLICSLARGRIRCLIPLSYLYAKHEERASSQLA